MLFARHVFALLIAALLSSGSRRSHLPIPPTPTWIGGYWDDDDFDDAVIAITAASAVEAPSPVDTELPLWVPIALVESRDKKHTGHRDAQPLCPIVMGHT